MNDEEIVKLLGRDVPPSRSDLTDEEVDNILLQLGECPPDRVDKVRKRYVEKLFEDLNPAPVQRIEEKSTFGRYIESFRKKVKLAPSDIALPLNQEPILIEKIERGEILPWECEPRFMAEVINLFRIHFRAFTQLVSISESVSRVRGISNVQARSHGGKASKERGDSTSRALELFLAHNSLASGPPDDITAWMENVSQILKERDLHHLVDSDTEVK